MEAWEPLFILNERGESQPETDLEVWAHWFETANRTIARTRISPTILVLTIFTGVGTASGETPQLCHTTVFGGSFDTETVWSGSLAEARQVHANLVKWCQQGMLPENGSVQ
jgi:hypothetical protein